MEQPVVADLFQHAQHAQHVGLADVDKRLGVLLARNLPQHVAEVYVIDLPPRTEPACDLDGVFAHLRRHARIEGDAVVLIGHNFGYTAQTAHAS